MDVESQIYWIRDNFVQPTGLLQIGAIFITYLIARIIAVKIRQHLEKDSEKVKSHFRIKLSPSQFAIITGYPLWLFSLWFCRVLFDKLQIPSALLQMALHLAVAWFVLHFAYYYIKTTFWSRLVYLIAIIFLILKIFRLWDPTVAIFDNMVLGFGNIEISVWSLIEAAAIFVLLWAATGVVNRFVAHRLAASDLLTTSDRILLQRVFRAITVAAVVLISLRAAGINLTTLAVTGGAIGFAIGIGLQKVGSNLVCGIMLLISKAIREGDVISFEKSAMGAGYGWITAIGLIYVQVATRDGTRLLIPNETFITQKIQNLSLSENKLLRLKIPFGISYKSDLNTAKLLAVFSAMDINRVLKNPGPICRLKKFGDNTVNFELRVWINDPQNGITSVKDAVLSEIWDRFRADGIEIAFPQRDLHIKDSVPLRIHRENDLESK